MKRERIPVCPDVKPGVKFEEVSAREKPVFDATFDALMALPGRERNSLDRAISKQVGHMLPMLWWFRIQGVGMGLKCLWPEGAEVILGGLGDQSRAHHAAIFAAYRYGIHVGEARAAGKKPGPFPR